METEGVPYEKNLDAFVYTDSLMLDSSVKVPVSSFIEDEHAQIEDKKSKPGTIEFRIEVASKPIFLTDPYYPFLYVHEMCTCQDWTFVEETQNWKIRSKIEKARLKALLDEVERSQIHTRILSYWKHLKGQLKDIITKIKEDESQSHLIDNNDI